MECDVVIESDETRIRNEQSEVDRLLCDHSKIRGNTSWKPAVSLRQGLAETIEYIRQNMEDYKSEIYNI
jgi:dTDP-glucose 4,6-dehydratase